MSEESISQKRTKEEIEHHWQESKKILEPEWGQIMELMERQDLSCKTLGKGDPVLLRCSQKFMYEAVYTTMNFTPKKAD